MRHLRAWLCHAALNLGQAARDVRYVYSHPNADEVAAKGSALHVVASVIARVPSLASNLYYAALPPQLHHSSDTITSLAQTNAWFELKSGYKPWLYSQKKETAA